MRALFLGLLAVIALTSARAEATPLVVNFTFDNSANGGGTVAGLVLGLVDNMQNQQATSVQVTGNTAGFGIGEYVGIPTSNSWTVTSGLVTSFNFLSYGINNTAPAVNGSSLSLQSIGTLLYAGLGQQPSSVQSSPGLTISVQMVPLPAAALLLVAGVAALTGVSRRRRAA